MYTEFHINANELDTDFIKKVKALFKSKAISIIIEEEQDETEYLLRSEANRAHLKKSLAETTGFAFSIDELKEHSKAVAKGNKNASKLRKVKLPMMQLL